MFQDLFSDTPSRRWKLAILYAAAGLALVAVALVDPARSSLFPRCQFHDLTGLHCPGCGATRATHQALGGHLLASLRLNALVWLVLPIVAYLTLSDLAIVARGRPLRRYAVGSRWWLALLALAVAFGIARNIPCYPFTLLAP